MKKIKCGKCQGSGRIIFRYQDGDHEHELDDDCDECRGKGYIEVADDGIPDIDKEMKKQGYNAEPLQMNPDVAKSLCNSCNQCNRRNLYVRALNLWGNAAQIAIAIEELGELIVKLAKSDRRHNGSTTDEIVEEIADVEIMMSQLRILFGDDLVEAAKIKKLARLEERVKYGEGST
jgi:NTP pyrophosphatase (non-canonical NTP hydrolase)